MTSRHARLLVALVLAGVAFRLAFFAFALDRLPVSSDEAWPGLMARHVLRGEFPVFYWGQNYMGAQECYLEAALFAGLGATRFSLRLLPLAVSLLFLWVSYALARRIYNREVGLWTLALLAVPAPYLALCGTMIPPPNYLAVATLGSLALLLTHRLAFEPDAPAPGSTRRLGLFIGLGAVLGFAFWLHLLIVSTVLVALLFLFLRDKALPIRRGFWAMTAAFVLAGLPFWWFNATHEFATFRDVGRQADWARTRELLGIALRYTLQFMTGLRVMFYGDSHHTAPLPPALFYPLAAAWIALPVAVIAWNGKRLWRLLTLSLRGVDGTALLLALVAAAVLAFARSARAGSHEARFLVPVLSALPILMAWCVWQLTRRARPAGIALFALVALGQAWGCTRLARAWNDPAFVAGPLELPDTRPLIAFLDARGIRHAYAHYWLSYRLTYETGERLIVSEPYNERFPGRPAKFLEEVSRADRVAYIAHPTLGHPPGQIEALLGRIGGTWEKAVIGPFTVFYEFRPPGGPGPLRELDRTGWRLEASHGADSAARALDGDPATAWTSGAPQAPGMTLELDLGAEQVVCALRIELGRDRSDFARGLRVETSRDGRAWAPACDVGDFGTDLHWDNDQPRFLVGGDAYACRFEPVSARFLRLTQTGADSRWWWTVAELRACAPAGP